MAIKRCGSVARRISRRVEFASATRVPAVDQYLIETSADMSVRPGAVAMRFACGRGCVAVRNDSGIVSSCCANSFVNAVGLTCVNIAEFGGDLTHPKTG